MGMLFSSFGFSMGFILSSGIVWAGAVLKITVKQNRMNSIREGIGLLLGVLQFHAGWFDEILY